MSTTTEPTPNEQKDSQERGQNLVRIQKVRDFIQDVLRPVDSSLGEAKAQQDEVKKFESRPYQLEAWDALWQAREAGKDRGLIHLATGLGKTSVAVFDYAKFRTEQEAKGETARALFVVHQNAILDQADERFNEVLPHLLPGVGMSRFTNQADSLPTGEVVFASFQALNRGVHKFAPDHFDYIVYDEAHHIEAKTYKRVVEHFTPKFQLGLTATPERGDEKDITEHFGNALYTKTLPEGIAEEYLADVHYRLMLDGQTKQLLQGGFKPKNMTELNRIFDSEPKLADVADAIKVAQEEIRASTGLEKVKTIIFSSDLLAADEMAQLIGGEGYHSGRRNDNEKKQVLQAFRNGDLETIVTRDMFNEGVDIPDARLIVFLRSTQSKTIFEQQLGRGLRKTDDKDEVTVLDFVANAERIRLLRDLAGEVRSKRGGNGNGGEGDGRGLKIGAGKSDFEFDQEVIDILALYNHFSEKPRARWSHLSNEELVQLALEISPDKPISDNRANELSSEGIFPSSTYLIQRFGSLTNFQEACGFELSDGWSTWSNDEIIDLAKTISPDEKLITSRIQELSKTREFPSLDVIQARFGSVTEFQKSCGFDAKIIWAKYSKDEIIELAKQISPSEAITVDRSAELANKGIFPGPTVLAQRFGSIKDFQIACGFEIKRDWSELDNNGLIKLAMELTSNELPTGALIAELSKSKLFPSARTIAERFGSIIDFQRACGFEVRDKPNWQSFSNEDIANLAKSISPNAPLSRAQIEELSSQGLFPGFSTIIKRFETQANFRLACGFDA